MKHMPSRDIGWGVLFCCLLVLAGMRLCFQQYMHRRRGIKEGEGTGASKSLRRKNGDRMAYGDDVGLARRCRLLVVGGQREAKRNEAGRAPACPADIYRVGDA